MKLLLFSLLIFFLPMLVDAQVGDRRIDENPTYFEHQDIRKALENTDNKSWMLYRTLRRVDRAKNKCVYADVKKQKAGENFYEFVQRYRKEDGTIEEETLFAFPYKTDPTGYEERKTDNGMLVKKNKDTEGGRNYVLIYSDYTCCDILRSLADENGAACELYLHDKCLSQRVPAACESMYGHACGQGDQYKTKVYEESCKNTTDITTKPTPEPPETPKETATTSTLPPGC